MSVKTVCETAEGFPATWNYNLRVTSLMRKIGFVELNQYLKEKDVINRYKRNIPLGETFDASYSKVVSSMIRDLITYVFSGINLDAICLEKQRGYPSYYFDMVMPRDNAAFRAMLINLEDLRLQNFLNWSTWQMRAGEKIQFTISFGNLPVTVRGVGDQAETLTGFITKLNRLAEIVRQCHPAPVILIAGTTQPIIPEIATELIQAAPVATVAPLPQNPLTIEETERRQPIALRRIN